MGKQPVSKLTGDGHKAQIIKAIQSMGAKHSTWQVFEDFLALSSLAISNAVDHAQFEERENQYMQIVKKYTKEELDIFVAMLSDLTLALEEYTAYPKDILGEIFHALELHNKYHGQFFTPNHICAFMGKITLTFL